MARIYLGLIISSLALTGCQQAKMSSTPQKSVAVAAPAPATVGAMPSGPGPGPGPVGPGPVGPGPQPYYPPQEPVRPGYPEGPTTTVPPTAPTPVTQPTPVRPGSPEPGISTPLPQQPPITPTVSTPQPVPLPTGVQPTYQPVATPPSIRDPEVVAPPPASPPPVSNPGTQIVVPLPPDVPNPVITPTQSMPVPAPQGQALPMPQQQALPMPAQGAAPAPANHINIPLPPAVPEPKIPGALPPPNPNLPRKNIPLPPSRPDQSVFEPKNTPSVAGQCGPVNLDATEKVEEAKLDVLFVVDTSASLRGGTVRGKRGELEQIASQMGAFVSNFPEKTDINIGVLLGHGHGKWVGQMFRSGNEAVVLKTKEIRNRQDLIQRLESKMKNVPNESGGAQGEALLYSLFQSVNESSRRQEMISQGMFRNDATLAVIMVTDEQDVCFDYASSVDPATGKPYVPNGKKDRKGQPIADPVEVKFFNDVCSKAYKGGLLKPGNVHAALSSLKGGDMQKLILMGMVYTSNNITPSGVVTNAREDENEMGHGVIEFVGLEKGKLVDLGSVQEGPTKFRDELKFLGDYTKSELSSNGNLACVPNVHINAVNMSTLVVQVQNAEGKNIGVFKADCNDSKCGEGYGGLRADGSTKGKQGHIRAFLDAGKLNQLLNAHKSKENKALFTFMTHAGIDPKTGKSDK